MKKIFNYALLAAALLIGVNVNAASVTFVVKNGDATVGTSQTTLQGALDLINVEDATAWTITMSNANYTLPVGEYDLKNATLNVQGKYLQCNATGDYTIKNATISGTSYTIYQVTNANTIVLDNVQVTTTGSYGFYNNVKNANLSLINNSSASLRINAVMTSISVEDGSALDLISGTFTKVAIQGFENCKVYGGIFALAMGDEVKAQMADGKFWFRKASSQCAVSTEASALYQINENEKFLALADAMAYVKTGETVKSIATSLSGAQSVTVSGITVDFDNKTITAAKGTSEKPVSTAALSVAAGAVVKNATLNGNEYNTGSVLDVTNTARGAELSNITVEGKATLAEGNFASVNFKGETNINGGTFESSCQFTGTPIVIKGGRFAKSLTIASYVDAAYEVKDMGTYNEVLPKGTKVIAKIGANEYYTLQAAFDAVPEGLGTSTIIELQGASVSVNLTKSVVLNANKNITLDLKGHDLVYAPANLQNNMQDASMFQLYKGILRVKNGNIINPLPVAAGKFYPEGKTSATLRCFFVCGEAQKTKSTAMSAYSTQLYIEEGVFVDCTYGKDAVEVYDYCGGGTQHYNAAFGVYIELEGKMHGEKYGIQMSGQVSAIPAEGETPSEYNYPKYVVKKNAEVYANPTISEDGGAGIYLGGYCFADIQGYVHGATGLYVKNGIVNITDAVIASDYTGTFVPGGNGASSTEGAGSAIVIVSSGLTYGETVVNINGDTKVTSQVGYAIEESVKTPDGTTKVGGVTIEGGTFEGGTEGGVVFSEATTTSGDKINIIDGNFTDDDVENYLPQGTTTTIVDDGQGNQTIVVSQPSDKPQKTDEDIDGQENLEWNTAKTQTISSGKVTVGFFTMHKGTVTIEKDAILEVTTKLIMDAEARIIVKPGATLISSGTTGIVAASVDNIVIQTDELVGAGQFLFNPAVNSNKNTNATLQIIANSFTRFDQQGTVSGYLNQRFGIPTHNAVKKVTAVNKDGGNVQVYFTKYVGTGFEALGYINVPGQSLNYSKMNDPFGYYQMQCNAAETGTIVSFSGEMVSNANHTIKVAKGWSTFANSYSGKLDVYPVLQALNAVAGIAKAVYVPQKNDGAWAGFTVKNFATFELDGKFILDPMSAFLFKNEDDIAAQVVMNYKAMVWDPAMETPATAPRHNSYEAMAKINVMQNDQNIDAVYMLQDASFTADIENGYDGEKYMNENVNFYVNGADMKQQTLATNVLEGTYLGFAAKEAGVYTLSFDKMAGNNLVLVDLVNGQEIDMVNGAQYSFKVDANYSNDNRFMVKNAAKAPTAMDKVDAKVNAVKVISDGQFRIVKDGRAYNAIGVEL